MYEGDRELRKLLEISEKRTLNGSICKSFCETSLLAAPNNNRLIEENTSSVINDNTTSQNCFQRQRVQSVRDLPESSSDKFQKQFIRLLHKVHETIERNEIRLERLDEKEVVKLEWNLVAIIVDRCLLWLFVIITLAITIGIIFNSPHAHEFLFRWRTSSSSNSEQNNTKAT